MEIELKEITVKALFDGYEDNQDDGVIGYGGKLDIRPPFQREFVYKDKQRAAVIDTVTKNFPLNVMYWAVKKDGNFEIIDGQQRTISICQYVKGSFSFNNKYFQNNTDDEQAKILNYELKVYFCSGTDSEKLAWFRTINIAGERLTDQELRNAVYSGSWVTDAKRYFSKNNCAAAGKGRDYMKGEYRRQDYLETVIKWVIDSDRDNDIRDYMGRNQKKKDAKHLWEYFEKVIDWVEATFTTKRPAMMKGVDWGRLYNTYKDNKYDPDKLEKEIEGLISDDDVTNKKGIYPYLLTKDERHLNIRSFSDSMKQKVYEKQGGICPKCNKEFDIKQMEADHITPWIESGKTEENNCQMLCRDCNRRKSAK